MDTARTGGSQNTRDKMKGVARQWEGETDDGYVVGLEYAEVEKKKKKGSPRKGSTGKESMQPSCQVDNCTTDMAFAKPYHRRHKVCPFHDKIPVAVVAGLRQRFCQQCSRFHELSEFDETKKSCRKRLAGHNERRRKCSSEHAEGSG